MKNGFFFLIAVGVLVGAHAGVATVESQVAHASPTASPFGLPAITLDRRDEFVVTILRCIEAVTLALIAFKINVSSRFEAAICVVGVAALLAVSLGAKIADTDLYGYVYFAKSASMGDAYAIHSALRPPAIGFEVLNSFLHRPYFPSPYGPAWQISTAELLRPANSIESAIYALKVEHAAFLCLAFVAIAFVSDLRTVALFALNPSLYENYVVQGHNDIIGISALFVGLALCTRKRVVLAIVCAVFASLFKITLLPVAIASVASHGSRRTRLYCALSLAIAVGAISLAVGRIDYVHALLFSARIQSQTGSVHGSRFLRIFTQALMVAIEAYAVGLAIFSRRFLKAATWSFGCVSGFVQVWYFPWGLPYALRASVAVAAFAVSLPLVAIAADVSLPVLLGTHLETALLLAIAIAALIEIFRTRGRGYEGAKDRAAD